MSGGAPDARRADAGTRVVLVGAGNMGGALLRGWLGAWDRALTCHVVDPAPAALPDDPRVIHSPAPAALCPGIRPDIVVLAVKPGMVPGAAAALAPVLAPDTCVISVAAGVTVAAIRAAMGTLGHVARVMPSIGALAGYSVSAGYAEPGLPPGPAGLVTEMFSAIGQMTWLEQEDHLHLVTALSGSGPAYYFAFCEALRDAAVHMGLPPEAARHLSVGTAIAAGRLLARTPEPENLRRMVTSPNGTTAAGLAALAGGDALERLARATLDAARKRSVELSAT